MIKAGTLTIVIVSDSIFLFFLLKVHQRLMIRLKGNSETDICVVNSELQQSNGDIYCTRGGLWTVFIPELSDVW